MKIFVDVLRKIHLCFSREWEGQQIVNLFVSKDGLLNIEKIQIMDSDHKEITVSVNANEAKKIKEFFLASYDGNLLNSNAGTYVLVGDCGSSLSLSYTNYCDPYNEAIRFSFTCTDDHKLDVYADASSYDLHRNYVSQIQALASSQGEE